MKAKKYFEACGRRDQSLGLPCKTDYLKMGHLPFWARLAYKVGYTYQEKRRW